MGEVGGSRHYDGRGLGQFGSWRCPACGVENAGDLSDGCRSCGSGSAKPSHVGNPPPAMQLREPEVGRLSFRESNLRPEPEARGEINIYDIAQAWARDREETTSIVDAFVAGWKLAMEQARAHTMQAPPVTADLRTLAPEGKSRRTILAALMYFREHVLTQAEGEIASGEWCSLAEVDELIRQLQEEEGSHE